MNFKDRVILSQKSLHRISKNSKEVVVKARYGPSKPTKIPLIITQELSYLIAAIIGDGHIRKDKLQITIDGFNKKPMQRFQNIANSLFLRQFNVSMKKEKGKKRYCLTMDSKAVYNLITQVLEVPAGKKSNIVVVPKDIQKSNDSIKCAFLQGIMATEGGKRKRGFGLSTSSIQLWKDLVILFADVGIAVKTDRWIHKKYKKEYYGISFKNEALEILSRGCQSGLMGCV